MKKIFSMLGIAVLFAFTASVPAYAMVKSDDTIIIREDEVINDDFFAAGNEVIIEGTVNGDVYVGASRLTVRGTVNGDVIAGATNIEVTGVIRDDLRVGGNNVSLIGAEIGDSVTVAGNELSIDGDSTVGGGLLFGGNRLTLDGTVGRGIMSGAESVRIDNSVGTTVRVAATNVTVDKGAVINGNFEYNSENNAVIDGEILGKVIKSEKSFKFGSENFMRWFVVGFTTWAYFGAIIIGALMVMLMPQVFRISRDKFVKKPWRVAGIGAVALLALLPLVVLLFMSIFGIPLALVLLVLWILAIYFAKFFVAYLVGTYLLNRASKKPRDNRRVMYAALLIGLAAYYLLRLLPVFGFLIGLITTVVGLGMILALYNKPRKIKA